MLKKLRSKWKRRWQPYFLAYLAKYIIRLLLFTCRFRIQGLQQFVETASQGPCILMLWHDRLLILSEILEKNASQFIYNAFISKSRDGELLAILAHSYKTGRAIRVPHNARHMALGKMINHLKSKQQVVLITPDGPRGPRYICKPGIAIAARQSAAKIIPFSWSASRFWQLSTWDKMMIPKPFSTIDVSFGSALSLEERPVKEISEDTVYLQQELLSL